jgi:photosystem II P680 reaction center D1 protein
MHRKHIISGAVIPSSNAIGITFLPIWEAASVDGGYTAVVLHQLIVFTSY